MSTFIKILISVTCFFFAMIAVHETGYRAGLETGQTSIASYVMNKCSRGHEISLAGNRYHCVKVREL